VVVTASAGVTFFPADARHPEALLKNAEQALRAAREQGRHQVAFFSPAMQTALQNRMRLIADLRQAVETRQLALHMQPIVDMTSRRIVGAEALLRWEHSVHGQISPAVFIPLAEETGLITVIGDAVFRDAAHWAKRWIHLCGDTFHVAVNQSPIQFRNQQGVLAWLDHLKTIDLPAGNMVIEITEGLLLDADADTRTLLAQLQGAGLRLAIDDFGTGYSSLSYLHKFPVDLIKIDQSFVRDLSWESGARTLSESIVAMAHKLGISVIAEGVETAEQHEILMRAGCDCAQGYHYARPMSTTAFDSLLRETGGILPPLAASA
jgi:EAL domain-containing protein (putative c-di-GMP-specific phosphodiesterase class I)